ncbi:hypothetical protein [Halobacteriovorax sp. DPLXC-1]|uniref:hypothetical protein n=1 Tax=Halobacteriovorax sp. DPLXC-1 TaxID=3110771 RepID=UPI002FEEA073
MIKSRNDYQVYSKYVNYHFTDQRSKFLKYKSDSSLSSFEKKLLNARTQIKDKRWNECLEDLEKVRSEDIFLMGERYLQMAHICLLQSRYEESATFGNLAVRYFEKCNDDIGLFRAHFNLNAAFHRAGLDSLAKFYLSQAKKYTSTKREELIVARAEATFLALELNFDESIKILERIENENSDVDNLEKDLFRIVAQDIYFKAGRVEKAFSLLEELLPSKVVTSKGRVLFSYHLMNFYTNDVKIPSKPDTVEKIEEFSLKWDFIVALKNGENELAKDIWQDIVSKWPSLYAHGFICKDANEECSIFMKVVNSLLVSEEVEKVIDLSKIRGKKAKILLQTLSQSKTPLRKEILIEKIWESTYSPSLDGRFYKLIERAKKMVDVEIKNNNNSYFIAG